MCRCGPSGTQATPLAFAPADGRQPRCRLPPGNSSRLRPPGRPRLSSISSSPHLARRWLLSRRVLPHVARLTAVSSAAVSGSFAKAASSAMHHAAPFARAVSHASESVWGSSSAMTRIRKAAWARSLRASRRGRGRCRWPQAPAGRGRGGDGECRDRAGAARQSDRPGPRSGGVPPVHRGRRQGADQGHPPHIRRGYPDPALSDPQGALLKHRETADTGVDQTAEAA